MYHYRLVGDSGGNITYGGDQTFTTVPLATVVTTGAASGITTIDATLSGSINPMGTDTQYQFEYGTDTSYGNVVPASPGEVGADSTVHALTC